MLAESSVVELLLELLSTAAVGAIDVWVGILGGLALGLPPILSGAASIAGGLVGAVLTVVAGERLQRWIYARPWLSKRRKRVERLWDRYGVVGVALQAPILTGAPLATLIALGLGAPPKRLLFWMSVSVVLWGVVITGAAVLGFSLFDG
ncbi:MAG: small multi-drug export protein [Actinomycetota bacterium]|nr:small multi-drug export protein [Actinomycetota bacterium]